MKILFKSWNEDCFPKLHNLVIGVFFSEVKVPIGKRRGSSNFVGSHYFKIRSLPFPLPLGFVKKAVATTVALQESCKVSIKQLKCSRELRQENNTFWQLVRVKQKCDSNWWAWQDQVRSENIEKHDSGLWGPLHSNKEAARSSVWFWN